jgi:outer membrane biosynthesis protein TonB
MQEVQRMTLRLAALLISALCLVAVATGQQQPVAPTPPGQGPLPDYSQEQTAWFDASQYLLRGNGVKLGRAVSPPDPQYSDSARKAKITGTVLLAIAIDAAGTVTAARVVCSLETQPGSERSRCGEAVEIHLRN